MTKTTLDEPSFLTEGILNTSLIKAEALRLGFSACGLAPAEPVDKVYAERKRQWVSEGRHADMQYMERNMDKRLDPRLLVEGARTVVSVALNYYPAEKLNGWVLSRYVYGQDYHDVVKARLRQLVAHIPSKDGYETRVFVDTAPLDERYWAWRCGLGWQGRSGQLILPKGGTYFFLGEIVLPYEADVYDTPIENRCGTCHACIDACPGQALRGDGTLDANRCLSYLTIENRGDLPPGTGQKMGACFYGCDRCAEVCPWNRFAKPTDVEEFRPSEQLLKMTPEDWKQLTVEQYRAIFKGSAVKRAKFEGLKRNIQALDKKK